jgi:hypothetical protein
MGVCVRISQLYVLLMTTALSFFVTLIKKKKFPYYTGTGSYFHVNNLAEKVHIFFLKTGLKEQKQQPCVLCVYCVPVLWIRNLDNYPNPSFL